MKDFQRILIIRMSSLGDIIHTLPTLYWIRKNWPKAEITWAVHEQFADILPGKPWIDRVVFIDKKQLKRASYLWKLHKSLSQYKFDVAIDLQGWTKSAAVAWVSGAKKKYGYAELREVSWLFEKALVGPHKLDHVIERYLDTVRCLGGTVGDELVYPLPDLSAAGESIAKRLASMGCTRPYALLIPGTRGAEKEWPLDRWVAIGRELMNRGYDVICSGTKGEKDKADYLQAALGNQSYFSLIGETSIRELVALIKGAALFVSVDTGPLHVANAVDVPSVALYGPTSPERSGPYKGKHVEIVVSPTSKASIYVPIVHDFDCMKAITVDMVWQAIERVLGAEPTFTSEKDENIASRDGGMSLGTES